MKTVRELLKLEKEIAQLKAKPPPGGRGFQDQHRQLIALKIEERGRLKAQAMVEFNAILEAYSVDTNLKSSFRLKTSLINAFRDVLLRE